MRNVKERERSLQEGEWDFLQWKKATIFAFAVLETKQEIECLAYIITISNINNNNSPKSQKPTTEITKILSFSLLIFFFFSLSVCVTLQTLTCSVCGMRKQDKERKGREKSREREILTAKCSTPTPRTTSPRFLFPPLTFFLCIYFLISRESFIVYRALLSQFYNITCRRKIWLIFNW